MPIVRRDEPDVEVWREGVETWMYAAAPRGAGQLTVFEQACAPGMGAPPHRHAVEELLRVLAGEAEVLLGDERHQLAAGDCALIPAGTLHGFSNTGSGTLRMLAVLAAPIFEARYRDGERDVRRWER